MGGRAPATWVTRLGDELDARRKAQQAISEYLDLLAYHHIRNSEEHMADMAYEYEMETNSLDWKTDGTMIVASAALSRPSTPMVGRLRVARTTADQCIPRAL